MGRKNYEMRRITLVLIVLIALIALPGCASLVGGNDSAKPVLDKEILGPNSSGTGVGLEVRVTNTGGVATEGTVFGTAELENGTVRQTVTRVALDPGESTVVTLRWPDISSLDGVVFKVSVEAD